MTRTPRFRVGLPTDLAVGIVVTLAGWLLHASSTGLEAYGWALAAGAVDGAIVITAVRRALVRTGSVVASWGRR